MADKAIGQLPSISVLSDSALIPAEQGGAAGKLTGAQFRQFAVDSVSPYASAAEDAAEDAAAAATRAGNSQTAAASSAGAAASSADDAEAARQAIEDMTVLANTLDPGTQATVLKETVGGVTRLTFGLPTGATGSQGAVGPAGPQGVQGPRGDTGTAVVTEAEGVYSFYVDNDSESNTYGHLFLVAAGSNPGYSIDENGHLILTVS